MKCYFCKQIITHSHYDRMPTPAGSYNVEVWKCYFCTNKVRHVYIREEDIDRELLFICVSAKIKGKNYNLQFHPDKNTCQISELILSDDRSFILHHKIIISLDFIPTITPDNIEEKLPTYILLS